MTPKDEQQKKGKGKLDFDKMKNACASKNIIKKVKRQQTEREKVFGNYLGDKGSISKIHKISKELLKVTNKKDNFKMGRELWFPDPPTSHPSPPPTPT